MLFLTGKKKNLNSFFFSYVIFCCSFVTMSYIFYFMLLSPRYFCIPNCHDNKIIIKLHTICIHNEICQWASLCVMWLLNHLSLLPKFQACIMILKKMCIAHKCMTKVIKNPFACFNIHSYTHARKHFKLEQKRLLFFLFSPEFREHD